MVILPDLLPEGIAPRLGFVLLGVDVLQQSLDVRSADGTINIQFGGCDGNIPNCLPITKGWNYTVRMFRPRPEILDGTWKFPEARPVS